MKYEYRVVYQREGKVQKIQHYAIKSRAEMRCKRLKQETTLRYARMQQREVGTWTNAILTLPEASAS